MKKAILGVVVAAAVIFACGGARAGTTIIDLNDAGAFPALTGDDQVISLTGAVNTAFPPGLALPAGTVTFGGAGQSFRASVAGIVMNDASTLAIDEAVNGGVKLTVGQLTLSGTGNPLNVTIGASSSTSNFNELILAHLEQNAAQSDASFTVNENSRLVIQSVDNNNTLGGAQRVDLTLNGGSAVFTNNLTLANGRFAATGALASTLVVGGTGLIVNGGTNAALSASGAGTVLSIHSGSASTAYANVIVGGTAGQLDLQGGAILNLGSLTLNTGAAFSAASNAGALNIHGNLAVNDTFRDAEFVDTTVFGTTTIAANAAYTVSGTENNYRGAMTLAGTLRHDTGGNSAILLGEYEAGRPAQTGRMVIDGGGLDVSGGGTLAIDNADIRITRAKTAGNTIAVAANSALDLGRSTLTIDLADPAADSVGITTGLGIDLQGYAQTAGNVLLAANAGGGRLAVTLPAVIGGGAAGETAALDIAGDAAHFQQGLILDRLGALTVLNDVSGVVTVGTAAAAADLILNGDALLHAGSGSTLLLASGHAAGGRILVHGGSSAVHGEIDAHALAMAIRADSRLTVATDANPALAAEGLTVASMDVAGEMLLGDAGYPGGFAAAGVVGSAGGIRILDGGRLTAGVLPAYLRGNVGNALGGEKLVVAKGGNLIADTASITATGFASVDIDGVFTAGVLPGSSTAARLRTDSDVAIAADAVIAMTGGLAATAVASADAGVATRLIETEPGKTIAGPGGWSSRSMFGDFGFALNDAATVLYIESVSGRVVLDNTLTDREQAARNLSAMWGSEQIGGDFAYSVYAAARGDIVFDGSPAGDRNAALFDAIAGPAGRSVGLDTVEYVNGAHLYGATDVAMDAGRAFTAAMADRAGTVRREFAALREIAAPDALALTAMNGEAANRLWFGGSGSWREVDARDGFSGYSYDGYGIVGGYDRAVAENVALGASLGYQKGDYRDRGALASDSVIESFSAGLYGVWSGVTGLSATLYGAFTSSSNALRELRRDPSLNRSVWSEADFTTSTWSLGGQLGYDYRLNDNVVLTPAAGLEYVGARNGDHDSLLDGVATQRITKAENYGVFLPVEVSARYDTHAGTGGNLSLKGALGYAYNLNGSGMTGTVDHLGLVGGATRGIDIHGRENARHTYRIGAGVRYAQGNFSVEATYDFIGGSGDKAHRAMINAGFSF